MVSAVWDTILKTNDFCATLPHRGIVIGISMDAIVIDVKPTISGDAVKEAPCQKLTSVSASMQFSVQIQGTI